MPEYTVTILTKEGKKRREKVFSASSTDAENTVALKIGESVFEIIRAFSSIEETKPVKRV